MKMSKQGLAKISKEKAPGRLPLRKWRGYCKVSFAQLGFSSVDTFLDDVRGR
jgi:hypothetical protein